MKINITTKKSPVIISIIGLIFFLIFFLYTTTQKKVLADEVLQTIVPMHLKIESIGVDALVESVGIKPSGEMDTPKLIENVGWFNLGVYPGEIGSAVIDGHYGWINNKSAAFDNLYKVKIGDIVTIKNSNNVITTFIVSNIKKYNPLDNSAAVFTSNDGKSHLNLITCGGTWDTENKNYRERLVIFTDKEIKE
ncbi:TPA: class F sortase [Candidatus Nomurabacteria bacterium]|nr:class F sortase [Candidatus Nomurabacteria bacterium]